MNPPTRKLALACAIAFGALALGCAPDAWNNRAAKGLNAFLNQVYRVCAPVLLGPYRMAEPLQDSTQFDYWLDQTSRLYYGGISAAAYGNSITAFFGAGNESTISCILAQLPSSPPSPPGSPR